MKQFIKKIAVFALVVFMVNFILNKLLPHHVQDERYDIRYTYLKNNIDDYNTLFFGTSRTLRHIIPSVFDSINAESGVSTKSFNLGTPANMSFETYAQYEHFLDEYAKFPNKNIAHVFVEIHPLSSISSENLFLPKSSYWVSYTYLRSIFAYLNARHSAILHKVVFFKNYALQYLIHDFGFNYFNPIPHDDKEYRLWLGKGYDGYIGYEDEILLTSDPGQKVALQNFKSDFLKDTMALERVREKIKIEYSSYPNKNNINIGHFDILKRLMSRSEEQGVKLFFVIHPRLSNYEELRAIKAYLPRSVIEIVDPTTYPDLWSSGQSFNHSHLDKRASIYFTKLLSKEALDRNFSSDNNKY